MTELQKRIDQTTLVLRKSLCFVCLVKHNVVKSTIKTY